MVREPRRGRVIPVAAAVAAMLIPCLTATASAAPVASRTVAQGSAEVREYWTPERMAKARPGSELLAGVLAPGGLLSGLLGGSTQARSSAQAIPNASASPYRKHGKVFFHLPSGDYVCSATVVKARNKRLVVTAGHCVFGEGSFATNWMFVPGKEGGSEPHGRWTAKRLAAPTAWTRSEDIRYDVGMVTTRYRRGKRLQDVVGARGIAFNRGRDLRFRVFGYPAQAPYPGDQLYRCKSPAQGTDSGPSPAPTRIDCDMTGGSSGGGWVIGRGRVNSVISYGYECTIPLPPLCKNPEEGKLFGPYFGSTIERLYRSQRGRVRAG